MAVLPLTEGYEPVVGVRTLRVIATVDYEFRTGLTKASGEVFLGGVIAQGESVVFTDNRSIPVGLQYAGDYSATFVDTSIPNWGSVKGTIGGQNVSSEITSPGALQDGQVVAWNQSTGQYELITVATSAPTFSSDIPVVLSSGKSLGKYINGDTIPATGLTAEEVLTDIALEYLDASFTSFSVSGQATTVEVGTTLSGSKTFTWTIDEGSGTVNVIDIYDITAATNIATDITNDGSEAVTVTTNQLNSDGVTQQWRGVGTDVTPDPDVDFNSSTFTVTSRFYRFYGATASTPTDDTTTRALPSSAWQTGTDVFDLWTGTTYTKFCVALPPGVTISSVSDLTVSGADITSEYVLLGTVIVVDAGGTNRSYNLYEMNIAIPYSETHQHRITAG